MPKRSAHLLRAIAVALLAVALLWWLLARRSAPVAPVSGTIEVDEIHVGSRYGGRVQQIPVSEGAQLKRGDLIVQMEAGELTARRDYAASQLSELESGPRVQEIEAARQEWRSQEAELKYAREEAVRAAQLFKRTVISQSEYDRAITRAAGLEQSTAAAQQRYRLLEEGTRPERIEQARAQLAEAEAQLAEMRVEAPAPSVLEVLSVKVGDVIAPNREVATLLLTEHLWVRVYVPELWLGSLKVGQTVQLRVDGLPGRFFDGVIEQINRAAEFTPRNVQTAGDRIRQVFGVKVTLRNDEGLLKAGMGAEIVFAGVPPRPSERPQP